MGRPCIHGQRWGQRRLRSSRLSQIQVPLNLCRSHLQLHLLPTCQSELVDLAVWQNSHRIAQTGTACHRLKPRRGVANPVPRPLHQRLWTLCQSVPWTSSDMGSAVPHHKSPLRQHKTHNVVQLRLQEQWRDRALCLLSLVGKGGLHQSGTAQVHDLEFAWSC